MYSTNQANSCRACNSKEIETILDLCDMPPGDKYASSIESIPTTLISSKKKQNVKNSAELSTTL